ncbi:MAG: UDP-N-acetylmuramoyl-L-alanyl-D-glutamate--2,6-diaminopimelate ligase [Candidatus Hydrogenedentota bacterium]|jgi:UDP-N-acetylmuramyl-tripeptide synthetase|uniref:UDP-N-acetylmuramoyl-L-alanyl-D-glutamate--2,6-diaminopimelate ligase n=1 Tax=Sumerlaea chitinivorans TaxID=2250252 RepID=A0A2Z4Y8G5_SUMC1|nr:UDP-N-acetylmuramoylalanyl-D-glutamate--2,6-diaminopimelate ligase [Candidatus Sumerlaea chitinivorans]RMH30623.1 MAG: UDP-N-acetylmuramoyl-L-alanyl-D-glutamate--2,6-diaminopimelate ligase [Candidatus Hydrogenedentota bacterium]
MKLSQLLAVVPEAKVVQGHTDHEITGVIYDPLRVKPGYLYVAINIYTQLDKIEIPDGHDVVDKAIEAGAVAVLLERDVPVPAHITKILAPSSRAALARLAGEFYGHPSRKLKLIGVTGTNGKTTTTHVVESILSEKYRVGLMGTLYFKVAGEIRKSKDTTPEPPDLQEIFLQMVEGNCTHCVMEVSSHGVDLHRVDGLEFEVGAWTNLTQDHLDYHKTMEAYRECKMRFISWPTPEKHVVLNIDDPNFNYFKEAARAKVVTFGIENPADIMARDIEYSVNGTKFTLVTPKGSVQINSRLRGQFNVYNSLTGAGVCYALGEDLETIKRGLEKPIIVAGRFQPVERGQDFVVVVDYAHTPDGLVKVLNAARATKPKRIITVFGCGGDRDATKRPIMGQIAEEMSDLVIVTDDNPRTEDPEVIVQNILAGIRDRSKVEVIHDRYQAIARAIEIAQTGDLVLIAGKGHETTQTLKDRTIEFNDFKVADELVAKRLGQKA